MILLQRNCLQHSYSGLRPRFRIRVEVGEQTKSEVTCVTKTAKNSWLHFGTAIYRLPTGRQWIPNLRGVYNPSQLEHAGIETDLGLRYPKVCTAKIDPDLICHVSPRERVVCEPNLP